VDVLDEDVGGDGQLVARPRAKQSRVVTDALAPGAPGATGTAPKRPDDAELSELVRVERTRHAENVTGLGVVNRC
jgi:hypothetical protein